MDCRIDFDQLSEFTRKHPAAMLTLAFAPDGATVNGVPVNADSLLFSSYTCIACCKFMIEDCLLDFYQNLDGLMFHLSYAARGRWPFGPAATHAFRIAQD